VHGTLSIAGAVVCVFLAWNVYTEIVMVQAVTCWGLYDFLSPEKAVTLIMLIIFTGCDDDYESMDNNSLYHSYVRVSAAGQRHVF
jgi:hypothetical protein